MKKSSYAIVVTTYNEEGHIQKTLDSLINQTIPPKQIIVVDDGSIDRTPALVGKLASTFIQLPKRGYSVAGKPELAQVVNQGLKQIKENIDYISIVGADHALPHDYYERIIKKMRANPKIAIASGSISGERFRACVPKGSGRVVEAKFWRRINNLQYPMEWGWESWLFYKAMQMGRSVVCFPDIITKIQRPTNLGKATLWGKAMYALGYNWKYVVGRCFLTFLKNPYAGFNLFRGWLQRKNVRRLDIADWVNQQQNHIFWSQTSRIVKRYILKAFAFLYTLPLLLIASAVVVPTLIAGDIFSVQMIKLSGDKQIAWRWRNGEMKKIIL